MTTSQAVSRPTEERPGGPRRSPARLAVLVGVVALMAAVAVHPGVPGTSARVTLIVFIGAVSLWVAGGVSAPRVAVGAALAVVLTGAVSVTTAVDTAISPTVWLLIAAFVLAAGVAATRLTARLAVALCARARTVRGLGHLLTLALLLTAFAVPSTSGRAAVALPVFTALAGALADRRRVVKALSILFPSVILLTAVATLLGAGAHLVTNEVLAATTGQQISFAHWLLLGIPLAILSAHTATELILRMFTTPADRAARLRVTAADLDVGLPTAVTGPLSSAEVRALVTLAAVIVGWITEPFHGLSPALVAVLGAVALTAPRFGTTTMPAALRTVPWSLMAFMVGTAILAAALTASGAALWLAQGMLTAIRTAPGWLVLVIVVVLSTAAHLVVQSRSARSSVLVPLIIPLALSSGLNPVALAFASTAAAGYCHTLTSSAKPMTMFSAVEGVETYQRDDLLRLGTRLAPLSAVLVTCCSLFLWPLLGLPLF